MAHAYGDRRGSGLAKHSLAAHRNLQVASMADKAKKKGCCGKLAAEKPKAQKPKR
jgi:hypothetical protein